MEVTEIIQHKGGHVVTTTPEQSIKDTVQLLRREKIGAVVVCNDDG